MVGLVVRVSLVGDLNSHLDVERNESSSARAIGVVISLGNLMTWLDPSRQTRSFITTPRNRSDVLSETIKSSYLYTLFLQHIVFVVDSEVRGARLVEGQ